MAKVSQQDGNFFKMRLDEDGQMIEFKFDHTVRSKRISGTIGPIPFTGEILIEQFETEHPDTECDIRVRFCVPAGSLERPVSQEFMPYTTYNEKLYAKAKEIKSIAKKEVDNAPFEGKIEMDKTGAVSVEGDSVEIPEPSLPSLEELGMVKENQEGAEVVAKEPDITVIYAERQFTDPYPGEEADLHKIVKDAQEKKEKEEKAAEIKVEKKMRKKFNP
jgi:hypothetical protein